MFHQIIVCKTTTLRQKTKEKKKKKKVGIALPTVPYNAMAQARAVALETFDRKTPLPCKNINWP